MIEGRIDWSSILMRNIWNGIQGLARFLNNSINSNQRNNIKNWYEAQKGYSYESSKYIVRPEHTLLISSFKNSENYIFNNVLEYLIRKVLKDHYDELSKKWWPEYKVFSTSDADDVLGWIDIIVENVNDWTSHWIDIACSDNPEYLEVKSSRTVSMPIEYNLFRWKYPTRPISRQVMSFSPKTLSYFIKECIKEIWNSWWLKNWQALQIMKTAISEAHLDTSNIDKTNFYNSLNPNKLHTSIKESRTFTVRRVDKIIGLTK